MRKNILYMIDSLHIGGTEMQLIQLIQHLDRHRYTPHLCTLRESGPLLEALDIPKLSLSLRSFMHPTTCRQVARLIKYVREHNIHIIQTFFQDPFLLAALARPLTVAKLVGSFRDIGFWRTPLATYKMQLAYSCFTKFIANSKAVKNHFARVDGIKKEKIEVIYNGINWAAIPTKAVSTTEKKAPVVGIVANCNRPVKRVDDFIRAAALVRCQWPEAQFVIVGDGHLRPQLEQLSRNCGLEESVSFTGSVTNPMELVRCFDVGVIASETEGFSNAILEYMACGIPVVATDAGGNPELVKDGENGYLVQVGDVAKLAERIGELVKNKDSISRICENNIDKVKKEFSIDKMVGKHQTVYDEVFN